MKQTDNFRYTEGVRKAQSDFATLDQPKNLMNLENHARIADDTERMNDAVSAHRMEPILDREFSFDDAPAGCEEVEFGHA